MGKNQHLNPKQMNLISQGQQMGNKTVHFFSSTGFLSSNGCTRTCMNHWCGTLYSVQDSGLFFAFFKRFLSCTLPIFQIFRQKLPLFSCSSVHNNSEAWWRKIPRAPRWWGCWLRRWGQEHRPYHLIPKRRTEQHLMKTGQNRACTVRPVKSNKYWQTHNMPLESLERVKRTTNPICQRENRWARPRTQWSPKCRSRMRFWSRPCKKVYTVWLHALVKVVVCLVALLNRGTSWFTLSSSLQPGRHLMCCWSMICRDFEVNMGNSPLEIAIRTHRCCTHSKCIQSDSCSLPVPPKSRTLLCAEENTRRTPRAKGEVWKF